MDSKNIELKSLLHIQPVQNMSDKIFEQISRLITDGTLSEGYTFPNETVLCEQLGVGRSSLREAYKALELSGYVTRTKRGTQVNSQSTIIGATPLKVAVENSTDNDFIEFRLMLECTSVALAAERTSLNDMQDFKNILTEMQTAKNKNDYMRLMQLDMEFHNKIAYSTHNSLIINTMTGVSEAWNRASKINFYKALESHDEIFHNMLAQHNSIITAIENKDPLKAKNLMKEHIMYVSK